MARRIRDYQKIEKAIRQASREISSLRVEILDTIRNGTRQYPFYQLTLPGKQTPLKRSIYLSGGIHGDEPAGVWAVIDFLRRYRKRQDFYRKFEFTILPCTNPFGYEYNTRENGRGIDLNRQFRNASPPAEVRLIKKAVGRRPFHLVMELHEDTDTTGFYLYELHQMEEEPMGREIIERVARKYPINRQEEIEGFVARKGLIRFEARDGSLDRMIHRQKNWPQAFYHYNNGSRSCFTTESPVSLKPKERTDIHLTALDAALKHLAKT